MQPTTETTLNVAAALLARTNMGMELPGSDEIAGRVQGGPVTLATAVYDICGAFMESDESEDIFLDEAEMWQKLLNEMGLDMAMKTWPAPFRLIAEASGE